MSLLEHFKKKQPEKTTTPDLPLIGTVLKDVMQNFYANPGDEAIKEICTTLLKALSKENFCCWIPVDLSNFNSEKDIKPLMIKHQQLGEAYKAYTGLNGYGLDNKTPMMKYPVLNLLDRVAKDSASGLFLDHMCGHDYSVILSREEIFYVLYGIRYIQKMQRNIKNTALDEEFLFAEKGLIYQKIDQAIQRAIKENSEESHTNLCEELIYAVLYNISYRVAYSISSPLDPSYEIYQDEEGKRVYMAFTNMESAILRCDRPSKFAKVRVLFDRVLCDNVDGLLLDGIVFISKEAIRDIVKYGYESIEAQPPSKRKFFLNQM